MKKYLTLIYLMILVPLNIMSQTMIDLQKESDDSSKQFDLLNKNVRSKYGEIDILFARQKSIELELKEDSLALKILESKDANTDSFTYVSPIAVTKANMFLLAMEWLKNDKKLDSLFEENKLILKRMDNLINGYSFKHHSGFSPSGFLYQGSDRLTWINFNNNSEATISDKKYDLAVVNFKNTTYDTSIGKGDILLKRVSDKNSKIPVGYTRILIPKAPNEIKIKSVVRHRRKVKITITEPYPKIYNIKI